MAEVGLVHLAMIATAPEVMQEGLLAYCRPEH